MRCLFFIYLLLTGAVLSEDDIINKLVGSKTRIRITYHSGFVMYYDMSRRAFRPSKKVDSIFTEIKINRDENLYILRAQRSWLCSKDDHLKKCEQPSYFSITPSFLGFQIKNNGKCLTAKEEFIFENCDEKNTQTFTLDVDEDLRCSDKTSVVFGQRIASSLKKKMKKEKKDFEEKIKAIKASPKTKATLWKLWSLKAPSWPQFNVC
ncbi:hypothetical protein GINT2_001299 [Glugoides intestinalis]